MRKCVLFSFFILFFFGGAIGQNKNRQKISLGAVLPDIQEIIVPNYGIVHGKRDFSDCELLLIDFWNIYCTSCLKSMPKLDSLQKEFGDKLEIVLVTENSAGEVDRVFSKIKMPKLRLRMIVGDTLLNRMFPHTIVPHHVWIDKNKAVRFITDGHNATRENINSFLNKSPINLHYKNDMIDFDPMKSLLQLDADLISSYSMNYSFFLRRLDQFSGGQFGLYIDSICKTTGFRFINQPLLEFYKFTFSQGPVGDYYLPNRMLLEVADKNRFNAPIDENLLDDWNSRNLFCYESGVPFERKNELYEILKQDLDRCFPYKASVEKRSINCFALIKTTSDDKLLTSGGPIKSYKRNDTLLLQNYDINRLISLLSYSNPNLEAPFINQTGINYKIDLIIHSKLDDLKSLRKELKKYDLDLVEKIAEIEMLVIKDK